MKRMGWVVRVKPEMITEYKRLHADVWPAVLAKIADCNIRNYTIYLREPENLLFAFIGAILGTVIGLGDGVTGSYNETARKVAEARK